MLLPVAGIIQVGAQGNADRYTYLPQIGIYVAVTWLVAQWRVNRAPLGGVMTGVIADVGFSAPRGRLRIGKTALLCGSTRLRMHTHVGAVAQNNLAWVLATSPEASLCVTAIGRWNWRSEPIVLQGEGTRAFSTLSRCRLC